MQPCALCGAAASQVRVSPVNVSWSLGKHGTWLGVLSSRCEDCFLRGEKVPGHFDDRHAHKGNQPLSGPFWRAGLPGPPTEPRGRAGQRSLSRPPPGPLPARAWLSLPL